MAQRRIRYVRTKSPEAFGPEMTYANFMADLLAGKVTANKLVESRAVTGHLVLDYDDPTGVGPRLVGRGDS